MQISLTELQFNVALGDLLQTMLPQLSAGQIIIGQTNRVASPEGDYVVFWPLRRDRLGTDVESAIDAVFTGFITPIAGSNTAKMVITEVDTGFHGKIQIGGTIFGARVAANTIVSDQISGQPGGLGTYTVTPSQNVGNQILAAGVLEFDQSTEVVMQIDVHGANSADNVQILSTLFRSTFAIDQLKGTGVSPLYADLPRQVPFHTAAEQFEERWVLEAHFQIIPVVSVPQQFASAVTVKPVNINTIKLPTPPPPSGLTTDLTNPANVIVVPATTGV